MVNTSSGPVWCDLTGGDDEEALKKQRAQRDERIRALANYIEPPSESRVDEKPRQMPVTSSIGSKLCSFARQALGRISQIFQNCYSPLGMKACKAALH